MARLNAMQRARVARNTARNNERVASGETMSRNVAVTDAAGNKTLQRNRQLTQNRGQVFQNGRMVADYGVGEEAARKAQGFLATIARSPYQKGQVTTKLGKQESAYTPAGFMVGDKLVQTGTPRESRTGIRKPVEQTARPIAQAPAPIYSKLAPVSRDQTAEEAARARIAAERGIDVNSASGATLSLLGEAVNQDVYGQATPKFSADAITSGQKATEQSVAASTQQAAPVTPVTTTPEEVQSIVTSEQAETQRDTRIEEMQTWQADSFGTVSDGMNELLSYDADTLSAMEGGADAQALLEERQALYEREYNSLQSEISRIYTEKAADYKIEAAQLMGSTISQLAAMGALGTTTAGIQYVNDTARLNSAKMLAFAAEEAAALESAYIAFQQADFDTAEAMIENAKATREEIRTIKKEQLENQKTMLELKKLEREDASQTIDAMVQSGLDVTTLPEGYLEYLDAKGGYAPGTSLGLWGVAQKERAQAEAATEQEAQAAAIKNATDLATFLEGTQNGGTVSLGGNDYTILAKGDVVTGSEIDGRGNVTVWSLDKKTGEVKTHSLGNIGSPENWEMVERNGVMALFNPATQEFKVLGDQNSPNLGYAEGGLMDIYPQGSINYNARHAGKGDGSDAAAIWWSNQCAAWVNDITGIGLGNSWADKQSKMDVDLTGMSREQRLANPPSVGDVAVQKISSSNLGHTFIVNSVIPIYDDAGNLVDYNITISESNWKQTNNPETLAANGIDPSVVQNGWVKSQGGKIGLVTHDRTMKLSAGELTGFASPGFKDPKFNFRGTDGGYESTFFGPESPVEEPKVVTINGKQKVWDSETGQYIDPPMPTVEVNPAAVESAKTMISDIDALISHPGLNNAVGPNFLTRGGGIESRFTGSAAEFAGGIENLATNLTFEKLTQLKSAGAAFGALSDSELRMIASSATKLNAWKRTSDDGDVYYDVSEDAVINELRKIQQLFYKDAGMIEVVEKSTGRTGWLDTDEFDPNLYERK